jgi:hypothetical protein
MNSLNEFKKWLSDITENCSEPNMKFYLDNYLDLIEIYEEKRKM